MKLALGTAQFGLDYGVSNTAGVVSAAEVGRILDAAAAAGADVLDTAPAYGDAEAVLGRCGAPRRFRIVAKTAPVAETGVPGVQRTLARSLERLQAGSVYGLLVHAAADLLGGHGIELAAFLERCREEGTAQRIGVSAYTRDELLRALDVVEADLVQVPVNVFDQRLVQSGTLSELHNAGVEVHARSAFLQGLLVMDPGDVPPYFEPIRGHLESWHRYCSDRVVSPLSAALGFVAGLEAVDRVVVGVESTAQLAELVAAAGATWDDDVAEFALDGARFVDPSRWKVGG